MEIVQISVIGIVAAIAVLVLRKSNPELSLVLGIGSGVVILIMILDSLFEVVYSFYNIAELTALDGDIFVTILKIIGVGYITEFSASICNDSGNKSIGDKVLFAGKIVIMIMALPIIKGIIAVVAEVL